MRRVCLYDGSAIARVNSLSVRLTCVPKGAVASRYWADDLRSSPFCPRVYVGEADGLAAWLGEAYRDARMAHVIDGRVSVVFDDAFDASMCMGREIPEISAAGEYPIDGFTPISDRTPAATGVIAVDAVGARPATYAATLAVAISTLDVVDADFDLGRFRVRSADGVIAFGRSGANGTYSCSLGDPWLAKTEFGSLDDMAAWLAAPKRMFVAETDVDRYVTWVAEGEDLLEKVAAETMGDYAYANDLLAVGRIL